MVKLTYRLFLLKEIERLTKKLELENDLNKKKYIESEIKRLTFRANKRVDMSSFGREMGP
jgi:hypothetical protein